MTAPGCLLQTGAVFCGKIVDAFGSRKEYTYGIRLRISQEYLSGIFVVAGRGMRELAGIEIRAEKKLR